MSAYIAYRAGDRLHVLTDGAAYDGAGNLVAAISKIRVMQGAPAVMTVRGVNSAGLALADAVTKAFADAQDFDVVIDGLQTALEPYRGRAGFGAHCDVLIAGVSRRDGPVLYQWATVTNDGREPFSLHRSQRGFVCGVELTMDMAAKLAACSDHRAEGRRMMERLRIMRAPNVQAPEAGDGYFVGCHVDQAVIADRGVKVERICTWPDRIGFRIDPYAGQANIIPLNRQQRRAMKREKRFA